jgi:medium-chain acyl-[acyl-carrier-protein] hydrolase
MTALRGNRESRWFLRFRRCDDAIARLICFHYAGGSASIFREWAAELPAEVEVLAVQLPGHGSRYAEPLTSDISRIVHPICHEIKALTNMPCYLFGHSMGALLAFEVATRLMNSEVNLRHLFVSATLPPHVKRVSPRIAGLPQADLINELRTYEGTPEEILSNPDLVRVLLPIWRADFEIAETYETRVREPLNCPLTALGGREDKWISTSDMAEWRQLTSREFKSKAFNGGHFYIHSEQSSLLQLISTIVREQENNYAPVC